MKRGTIIACVFISILLINVVSAFSLADLWNKITGNAIAKIGCNDSDGGMNYYQKGKVSWYVPDFDAIWEQSDTCRVTPEGNNVYSGDYLIEMVCESEGLSAINYLCPEGCENGACIKEEVCNDSQWYPDLNKVCGGISFIQTSNCGNNKTVQGTLSCLQGYYCENGACIKEGQNEVVEEIQKVDCGDVFCSIYSNQTSCLITDCCAWNVSKGCSSIKCSDSDMTANYPSGKNYDVFGTAKGFDFIDRRRVTSSDGCRKQNLLTEVYCDGIYLKTEQYTCEYGCSNGACMQRCVNDSECSFGYKCENETCVVLPMPSECVDSDGGKDYNIAGTISTPFDEGSEGYIQEGNGHATDRCQDNQQLIEYYCENNFGASVGITCPFGCKDGSCFKECVVTETSEETCNDGLDNDCNGLIDCNDSNCALDINCIGISIGVNNKNSSKYSSKEIFLISDRNWRDVLPLVPITTWTDQSGDINVYPTLIYHEENSGFDADSIIYFMQQYFPDKVTIIGNTPQELDNLLTVLPELGAGLNSDQLQRITTNNYFSYWQNYNDIVYVEDNYELALLASTYASLINAPLIIQGTSSDTSNIFSGKNITCIGSVSPTGSSCNKQYNLEQLQQKYVDKTNTDKIILVNSDDWNINVIESFQPEKSANAINEIYGKTSLAAPILASAKHELIISTTSINYTEVDNFIENKINSLTINPEYLTILASPNAIEMSKETNRDYGSRKLREEVDNHIYGNLDLDPFQELAVGRIFSLTTSDVFSYIARDLFYSETPKDNEFSIIWPAPPRGIASMKIGAIAIEEIFKSMGLNSVSFITNEYLPPDASEFKNKFMLTYSDHAWTSGGSYNFNTPALESEQVWLNSPLVFMEGCGSCAFELAHIKSELFCANLLRRGAIFHYGATVDASGTNWDPAKMIVEELLVSENIGQAVKSIRNKAAMWGKHWNAIIVPEIPEFHKGEYDSWDILIGDPTFNPNLQKPELEELTVSLNKIDDLSYTIDIFVPEVNKNIKVNYTAHNNLLWERELFNYPFGNKIGRIFKEYYEVYNDSELSTSSVADDNLLLFSLNIPDGYKIKGINKVEYVNSSETMDINYMPVFESGWCLYGKCEPNFDYILYAKDEGLENTYYFLMYFQYGGDPSIIKTQDVIPQHQFKIYLELEGGI